MANLHNINTFGQETFFNESATFYRNVNINSNLTVKSPSFFQALATIDDLSVTGSASVTGSLSVSGDASFSGITTFANDVFIEDNLQVRILTVTEKLNVGVGGTILTTSGANIGIGTLTPQAPLDVYGNILASGNIGLGSLSPEQRIDIDGSIKIDENIFDSVNTAGVNGYFLSRDAGGIRWVAPPPTAQIDGVLIENEGILVGSGQTFTTLNFIGTGSGGDVVNATVNAGNSNIVDISIVDHWTKNGSGGIHTSLNVGVKNATHL